MAIRPIISPPSRAKKKAQLPLLLYPREYTLSPHLDPQIGISPRENFLAWITFNSHRLAAPVEIM